MISNAYLVQMKDMSLVDLVQSQNTPTIFQLIQLYDQIGSKSNQINFSDAQGFTALHKACGRGMPEIVELLLSNGANPNVKNNGGETPAHLAARRGNPVVLNILKSYKANFEDIDDKGQNIIHNAVMSDSVLVLLWIEASTEIALKSTDSAGLNPLHLSCKLGKVNCIKFFLRKSRCDLNERTRNRDNCLHLLVKYNQLKCIPLIIFHAPRKLSICSGEFDFNEEKSSIIPSKNADNKTPVDLYYELPSDVRNVNRIFAMLFFMINLTTLKQLEFNLFIYRIFLFLFPFVCFLFGILLSIFMWPDYATVIYPITAVICIGFIRTQYHRISQLDTRQNPIFAGAFLAGVLHDLLCFKINIYPSVKGQWEVLVTIVIIPIFTFCYLRLLFVDSGKLQLSETSTSDFGEFLTAEIAKQKINNSYNLPVPLDRFCQICETVPKVERVKHCKLCDTCIVNMDHHCLFLMKCIARNNIRNFIFLIFFSLFLITLFLFVSLKVIVAQCGQLTGASPLPYIYCSCTKQTWIATCMLFNSVSLLWGFVMLFSQLQSISYNSTYYYQIRHKLKYPLYKRMHRIMYFMLKGRYYLSNEERRILENI